MLADPNFDVLLMLAGLVTIYIELLRPGLVIAGVAGGIAFLVGLASLVRAPLSELHAWTLAALVPFAALTVWIVRIAILARKTKRLR